MTHRLHGSELTLSRSLSEFSRLHLSGDALLLGPRGLAPCLPFSLYGLREMRCPVTPSASCSSSLPGSSAPDLETPGAGGAARAWGCAGGASQRKAVTCRSIVLELWSPGSADVMMPPWRSRDCRSDARPSISAENFSKADKTSCSPLAKNSYSKPATSLKSPAQFRNSFSVSQKAFLIPL